MWRLESFNSEKLMLHIGCQQCPSTVGEAYEIIIIIIIIIIINEGY